jgi:AcrR family transcriptional regulator
MDEKFNNILKESLKLFMKYGLRNLSMDDICRDMGISKKTLYLYVENKADLVDKIMQFHIEQDRICLYDPELYRDKNAIDVLLAISKNVSEQLKDFKPSISFELQKYYPDVYRRFMETKRIQVYEGISKNLQKGIDEGIYRQDIDVDLVSLLYIQNLEDVHNIDFFKGTEKPFEKVFSVMFENHIRSISNAKGLEYFERKKVEG